MTLTRIRVLCFGLGLAALGLAGASLFAEPRSPSVCCSDRGDCDTGKCCDFDGTGQPPCDTERPGYCLTICIAPGRR